VEATALERARQDRLGPAVYVGGPLAVYVGGPGSPIVRLTIEAEGNANRLSIATVLSCTNDGFTGVDSIRLPGGFALTFDFGADLRRGDGCQRADRGHDCRSVRSHRPVSIPGDGLTPRPATAGVIAMHPGIVPGRAF